MSDRLGADSTPPARRFCQLTAARRGTFELGEVRLTFRVNGGRVHTWEGADVLLTVCADDPAPRQCPEPVAEDG